MILFPVLAAFVAVVAIICDGVMITVKETCEAFANHTNYEAYKELGDKLHNAWKRTRNILWAVAVILVLAALYTTYSMNLSPAIPGAPTF